MGMDADRGPRSATWSLAPLVEHHTEIAAGSQRWFDRSGTPRGWALKSSWSPLRIWLRARM
ncbi:hypothetical protein RB9668 [Rhodopirellula baltica SH 1]|uniref:Uncharacterized protein n=1 Tax=Rhodopirellula baltica (strain DSM 10527 / NCIMB 13988 / SH1) TaxID=243090 RepID=Q7UL81_RHOBA|nr:hypothetical protein RB9668 [Rhodopirellula baltica SH 1]